MEKIRWSLAGALGAVEVVAEVAGEQHGHEVGGRHPGAGMAGAGGGRGADGVDAELLGELAPEGRVVSVDVWRRGEHDSTVGPGRARVNGAS